MSDLNFANRLKSALEKNKMRPVELSNLTMIGKSAISMYMSGQHMPSGERIHKIATVLKVNDEWLLGYEPLAYESKTDSVMYYITANVNGVHVNSKITATSKHEAIGFFMELIPKATYEDITNIKEDT